MRIGLFGGAFDPPHNAHVALAQAALAQLSLSVLHVVPTGDAWHKARDLSPGVHRLAMCHQAFAGIANLVVDDLELLRQGPSYTIDTLATLRQRYAGAEFFVVMGLDQAAVFDRWHQSDQILSWAQLAIAKRTLEGQDKAATPEWHNRSHVQLHLPVMPLSATDIRQRCRAGADLSALLSPAVIQYIHNNHLYLDHHDPSF